MSTGALARWRRARGKTLAAVAPTLLGALRGKGALVVTTSDYARRDAIPLVLFLGSGLERGSRRGDDGAGLRGAESSLRPATLLM